MGNASNEPRLSRVDTLPMLPARPRDGHKGTFGRAFLIGGAVGMPGAVGLAGLSAMRSGAGLVFLAVPQSIQGIVAAYEPAYQVRAVAEDEAGRINLQALPQLTEAAQDSDAVAIGPGLSRSAELTDVVRQLYSTVATPMVVDADGLNAMSMSMLEAAVKGTAADRILTPHPGEFARLCRLPVAEVQADRQTLAAQLAKRTGTVVLLKGPETIITDGEHLAVNQTGNSGMATGGSGDVLTGILAGLLAQGMSAFEAAQLGAHLHGLAGDLAAGELSEQALIASDLPDFLGRAWKMLI